MIQKHSILASVVLILATNLHAAGDPWPMFMQNARHTGQTNTSVPGIPSGPFLKWSWFNPDGSAINCAPAIGPDGTIYFGSDDGNLFAITNGAVKWTFMFGGNAYSSPAIGPDGTIYIGGGNLVYAVQNGVLKWAVPSNGTILGSPLIASDGTVYFASVNFVAAYNNAGGQLWHFLGGAGAPALSPNGVVYVGAGNSLEAIQNGIVKWNFPMPGIMVTVAPVIGPDGTIYVADQSGNVSAISTNGLPIWTYPIPGALFSTSSPALGTDGTVYLANNAVGVSCLDAVLNGVLIWTAVPIPLPAASTPSLGSDGTVYFACQDGNLYAVNNGSVRWAYPITPPGTGSSSPALGNDGTLCIGSANGFLYCFRNLSSVSPPAWATATALSASKISLRWQDVTNAYLGYKVFRATVNNVLFSSNIKSLGANQTNYVDSGLLKNTTYYYWIWAAGDNQASSGTETAVKTLAYTNPSPWPMYGQNVRHTGQVNTNVPSILGAPVIKWSFAMSNAIFSSPAIAPDGTVYVACSNGLIYAITNGSVKWTYNVTGSMDTSSPAIGADGTIYIGGYAKDNLLAIGKNGILKWMFVTSGNIESSPVVDADGTVYIGGLDQNLYAITNGAAKWIFHAGGPIYTAPAVDKYGTVYFGCVDGNLYAITNGIVDWTWGSPCGPMQYSSPIIDAHGIVYVGGDMTCSSYFGIIGLDGTLKYNYLIHGSPGYSAAIAPDGDVFVTAGNYINQLTGATWSQAQGTGFPASIGSPVICADGTIVVPGSDGRLNSYFNQTLKWSIMLGGSLYGTPAIGSDGTIYIGSTDHHLYAVRSGAQTPVFDSCVTVSTQRMDLAWDRITNVTSFTLYQNTVNSLSSATKVATLPGNVTNYTVMGLSTGTAYFFWIKATGSFGSSGFSSFVSNTTYSRVPPPPTFVSVTPVSSSALEVIWHRIGNTLGWTLYRNIVQNISNSQVLAVLPPGTTNYPDSGLMADKSYYYYLKAFNAFGSSGLSLAWSNSTWAVPASFQFNPLPGTIFTNPGFIMVNTNLNGVGGAEGYYYKWNNSSSYVVSTADGFWSPLPGMVKTNHAGSQGAWYFHVASLNNHGVLCYPQNYGPFFYFTELVTWIKLGIDKPRIQSDGKDEGIITTTLPISNARPPYGNITTKQKFNIRILEGICDLVTSGTDQNGPYVMSSNAQIRFKVKGTTINNVRLNVFWEADPLASDQLVFLISPTMDLGNINDAVSFNNVLDPTKGDKLEIYLNSTDGEKLIVRIYDIQARRLIRTLNGRGGTMANIEYDLLTEKGQMLPDGLYGVSIQGMGWKKDLKFVVSRWYKK